MVFRDNFFDRTDAVRIWRDPEAKRCGKGVYAAPFTTPEDRLPTVVFPRDIPFDGEPADMAEAVGRYSEWMGASVHLPKVFIDASQGHGTAGAAREHCLAWPNGEKLVWLFDIREPSTPVSISAFKSPTDIDYKAKAGHFGPHNLHENRPGTFVSSDLIFTTYQNAGVRVFDIRDRYAPREVGALVPPTPARLVDTRPGRPNVIQCADVFVDAAGIVYSTDYNGGLYVMEFQG